MHPQQKPPGANATLFVWATVVLSMIGVSLVIVVVLMPFHLEGKQILITGILGIITPVIVALTAAAIQQVHLAVNSRLSQLLTATKELATARERSRRNEADKAEAENKTKPDNC